MRKLLFLVFCFADLPSKTLDRKVREDFQTQFTVCCRSRPSQTSLHCRAVGTEVHRTPQQWRVLFQSSWFASKPSTKNVIKPSVRGKGYGRHKRWPRRSGRTAARRWTGCKATRRRRRAPEATREPVVGQFFGL